jgi:hypothetical protein
MVGDGAHSLVRAKSGTSGSDEFVRGRNKQSAAQESSW